MTQGTTIAIVGGTGKLGAALARRLAKAGRSVIIGSRAPESAQKAADEQGSGPINCAFEV
jgi:8-hydroxy-5-deazaflavin:NADPH oxidoreductase